MDTFVRLGAQEKLGERPFTALEQTAADLGCLGYMACRLRQVLQQPPEPVGRDRQAHFELTHGEGRRLRVIVARWAELVAGRDLAVVGFFGHRREAPPDDVLRDKDELDQEMIGQFGAHPEVLSYSSMELECGNFGNLVILSGPEGMGHWNANARHAYAARVVAPRYYTTVRLHNGLLPGGVASGCDPVLLRTKYYDFQGEWPWWAVREYGEA